MSLPHCPSCQGQKIWKDGIRHTIDGPVQRWLCRDCGLRFSQEKPLQKNQGWQINSANAIVSNRQVCELLTEGSKNLAEVETRNQEKAAGATAQDTVTIKGKIIDFAWKLKREGYSDITISSYSYILKNLVQRGADIYNPENVKDIIAMQETWSIARKNIVAKAYSTFLKINGLSWKQPEYKPAHKIPFIPTEKEMDDLIAGCGGQMPAFLQLLKETAIRRGEAFKLTWRDADLENNIVRVTPEKGSEPRIFKITSKLAIMLGNLPKKSEKVFHYKTMFYLRKSFDKQRKRIAHKLGNPKILQIHFHTFRHWKATMLYHQTKDILYVMQFLGHKNIKNTLIYVQLAEIISKGDDEYICKAAKTLEEATKLIEIGFEFVTDIDGYKLFKKRK